jgi:hypothetical protein
VNSCAHEAVRNVKNNKSPEDDEINNEYIACVFI